MRVVLIGAGLVLALVLGAVQVVSSLALRDAAQPGSWVRLVPPATAARVDALDPRLPLPAPLRLVLAREALASGDVALAERQIAALQPSGDRAELLGLIAERRGDGAAAVRDFLDAGDALDLERLIAREQRSGNVTAALRLEHATIERLRSDRAQTGALPDAYYRLGLLEQDSAYRLPRAQRRPAEQRSLAAYEAAVALAPLAERYLIAAGNQELNLGDLDRAQRYFERARDVDPTSVDAVAGFGDLAYRRGRLDEARAYLATAQAMDAQAPAVRRLVDELNRH
jgi:tetratricopeptide (TPR) repeat protein